MNNTEEFTKIIEEINSQDISFIRHLPSKPNYKEISSDSHKWNCLFFSDEVQAFFILAANYQVMAHKYLILDIPDGVDLKEFEAELSELLVGEKLEVKVIKDTPQPLNKALLSKEFRLHYEKKESFNKLDNMATNYSGSRCPKCESTFFEVCDETPEKSSYILMFIRCRTCKTVVGVQPSYNTNHFLQLIMDKLGINYRK